jgi:hypothetical protein
VIKNKIGFVRTCALLSNITTNTNSKTNVCPQPNRNPNAKSPFVLQFHFQDSRTNAKQSLLFRNFQQNFIVIRPSDLGPTSHPSLSFSLDFRYSSHLPTRFHLPPTLVLKLLSAEGGDQ